MCINVTHTPFDSLILIPSYLHTANQLTPSTWINPLTNDYFTCIQNSWTYNETTHIPLLSNCNIQMSHKYYFWLYPWYLISCVISCVYCNISNKPEALTLRNWWGLAVPASSQNDHHFVSGSRSNVSQNLAIIIYHITCSSWRTSGRTP